MAHAGFARGRAAAFTAPILLLLAATVARGSPPEQSPAALSFNESKLQFPSSQTVIAIKACWGAYIVYVDIGPVDQMLVYRNYSEFVVAYPSPGFFGLAGAATDTGVIFVGRNIFTNKIQLAVLDLGPQRKAPVFYDLDIGNAQSVFVKGNGLGDYAGGSTDTGKLFVHWHTMPVGTHTYYTLASNTQPMDVAYGWNSFYFTLSGVNSLARVSSAQILTIITLIYSPLSIAYGPAAGSAGIFEISDRITPGIWEYSPITGTGARRVLRAVTYGLEYTPDGLLMGFQLPRTISIYDIVSGLETSYVSQKLATIMDFKPVPGRYPFGALFDGFDSTTPQRSVVLLNILGLALVRDLVSARREGDFEEPRTFTPVLLRAPGPPDSQR